MCNVPEHYPYDNIYTLFPLVRPETAEKRLESLAKDQKNLYDTQKPHLRAAIRLEDSSEIRKVLEDRVGNFSTPYQRDFKLLTNGAGYVLRN